MFDDFPKLIELDELTKYDEPTIQIVRPHEYNRLGHVKAASEALEYIKHVEPRPGQTIILVLAMTAGEFYGCNRNGDAWSERPLIVGPTKITEDDVLPKHYQTFENANVFKHHINKDPEKRVGDVIKAFYNWPMHRVELLLSLLHDRAEDIVNRIEDGEFPAVSMGCFTAGNMVSMSDGTRKPIEDVEVGDEVLTHRGRAKKVTKLHRRQYTGELYTIKAAACPEIVCTSEHPLLACEIDDLKPKNDKACRTWDENAEAAPDWVHAACLGEHLLMSPTIQETNAPDYLSAPFAKLFGAYVADGHVVRNKKGGCAGVELNVNKNNPIVDEVDSLCDMLKTPNRPVVLQHPASDQAYKISIYGSALAEQFGILCPGTAKNKRLDGSVLRWPHEAQRVLLGAYANGDGCGTKSGALQLSTASPDLAWQLSALLHRLNIPSSLQRVCHRAGSGFNACNTTEHIVFIGAQWAQSLSDVCYKVKPVELHAVRRDRFMFGKDFATPIRSAYSEHVHNVPVYNFEVEEDESYVVNGISAHNCRVKHDVCAICGHPARNRSEYCDHAKYQLGELLPNGKRVFVWNPSPKFFDISMVRRPADRLGFMMKKVADYVPEIRSSAELGEHVERLSRKVASLRKMSLMHKLLTGHAVAANDGDSAFMSQVAKPAAQKTPPLDDAAIRSMLAANPAAVLATLSSMGILLTTPEFIKFFVWKMDPTLDIPPRVLDRAVAAQTRIFEALSENPEILDEADDTGLMRDMPTDKKLAAALGSWAEKRSLDETPLLGRLLAVPTHAPKYAEVSQRLTPAQHYKLKKLAGVGALLAATYTLNAAQKPTKTAVKLAMDVGHYPASKHTRIPPLTGNTFDELADAIGESICL